MKSWARCIWLSGCASLAFVGMTTEAHSAENQSGVDLESDIIVTARRVEERLQDVPISISVFNEEQLSQRNVTAGTDLALYTPSLSVTSQFGPERASYAIRGFVQEANTAPSVGVFFADVVTPRGPQGLIQTGGGAGPGRFFDLQNVQVLKGPQGTLFGRNTTGGSVLLVPAKPTSDFGGFVEASAGNYDMKRLQAVVNVPLSDTFRVRAGFDRQVRDGWLHNKSGIGPKRFNDTDYWAARVSIVADLTPDLENTLIGNLIDSKTNGSVQKLIACAPNVFVGFLACDQMQREQAAGDGFYDVRQSVEGVGSHSQEWQLVNTTVWKASDTLTIKNIASYGQQNLDFEAPIFGTDFLTPAVPAYGLPAHRFGFLNITSPQGYHAANQETVTEELQFQGGNADNSFTWQAGAYFESSRPLSAATQVAHVLMPCTDSATPQCMDILGAMFGVPIGSLTLTSFSAKYRSIGLYGQMSYALTDKLTMTGGLRYTWDKSTVDQTTAATNYMGTMPLPITCPQVDADAQCATQFYQKSSKPTWLINFEYKPTYGVMLFGKYARGYRSGSVTGVLPKEFAITRPEKVDNFELGLKSEFRGPVRGYFNVTGFYNNFSDQQLSLSLVDNPAVPGVVQVATGVINVGKSRIYGAEVEAGLKPVAGFDLSASYGYLNTRVRSITLPDLGGSPYLINSSINVGDDLLQAPRHKLSATARYTLPLDPSIGAITFGATYSHSGSSRTNYSNRQGFIPGFGPILGRDMQQITTDLGVMPRYDLLNLNMDWKNVGGSDFDLSFFATNVTKEKFVTYAGGLLPSLGFETVSLNEPRMYGMRARYSF